MKETCKLNMWNRPNNSVKRYMLKFLTYYIIITNIIIIIINNNNNILKSIL